MAVNQWRTAYNQILIFNQTISDLQKLVQDEQTLFNNGESSLFLINYCESSYIDAQVKLIDTLAENMNQS